MQRRDKTQKVKAALRAAFTFWVLGVNESQENFESSAAFSFWVLGVNESQENFESSAAFSFWV
jgi:hypothetical protein